MADLTQFDIGSAQRIARVVRQVEQERPPAKPLSFRVVEAARAGKPLRLATFTSEWGIGVYRTVTLHDSTQTASVINWCNPSLDFASGESRKVVFANIAGTNSVVEIQSGYTTPASKSGSGSNVCGKSKTQLITLSFASCFGSGAAGQADEPGGSPADDAGPISKVSLTSPGDGYAKYGRVEPTFDISGSGEGAAFSVSLSQSKDKCDLPVWGISGVTVEGGSGYVDDESLTITPTGGSKQETAASLKLNTIRDEPTLTATVSGSGAGAVLGVTLAQNAGTPETWKASKISVSSGGSGYTDFDPVTVSVGTGDVEETAAQAVVRTTRGQPTLSLSFLGSAGSGHTLGINYSQSSAPDGRSIWAVSSLTITNGGAGFAVNDIIVFSVTQGIEVEAASGYVSAVDSNGAITAVSLSGGQYYRDLGVADIVTVSDGGRYYNETPGSVTVVDGGAYYLEDATLPALVAGVTVTISQSSPSNGSGGKISASVDANTKSGTFGKITGLTIDSGGSNYLAYEEKPLSLGGTNLAALPGYQQGVIQVLGHGAGECLQWFSVSTCTTATSSP